MAGGTYQRSRLLVAIVTLMTIVLFLIISTQVVRAEEIPQKQEAPRVSVWSGVEEVLEIRIVVFRSGKELLSDTLSPGGQISFLLPSGSCVWNLLIWVNDEQHMLRAVNLCSEESPDGGRNIFILTNAVEVGDEILE